MKKLFFAALALTAMVACSKDDVPTDDVLTSSKKSVFISIANMASGTRAEGDTTTGQSENVACTTKEKLVFLFADKDGNVLQQHKWNVGTDGANVGSTNCRVFHGLPEQVTKVGVIANVADDATFLTLEAASMAWKNETTTVIAGEYNDVIVYGYDEELLRDGEDTYDEHTYPLMKAEVTVTPYMSRIEIGHIGCTDLGTKYSKIGIESLSLTGGNTDAGNYVNGTELDVDGPSSNAAYTHNLGVINSDSELDAYGYVLSTAHVTSPSHDSNTAAPESSKVWSWNILPQDVSNLVVNLYVKGNGYKVQIPKKTVTITKYRSSIPSQNDNDNGTNGDTSDDYMSRFNSSNIYKFNIDFAEGNIDTNTQYLCVDVDVTIANWVVNNVDVGFQTNPIP